MLSVAVVNLKRMLKDKKALIGILMAPIIVMFLLGFIVPNGQSSMSIEIGVVDYANSTESKYILHQLTKDTVYDVKMMREEELYDELQNKYISMGMILPKDLGIGKKIRIINGENRTCQVLQNKVNNILKEITLLGEVPSIKEEIKAPINYINRYNSSKMSFILGFVINFMMFSMIYIINELMDLKRWRVLRRCYTTPHSSFSLLGGIVLSMFFLLGIQIIMINLLAYILYKEFLITSLFGGIVLFVPFILVILGIGIIVSKIWKNPDLSPIIANLIIIPTGMISGTFLPKGMLPSYLEKFAFLAPQYWIANGIEKLNQGLKLEILPNALILTLIALCLLTVSSYDFKGMLKD